jgi:hypothetical protein
MYQPHLGTFCPKKFLCLMHDRREMIAGALLQTRVPKRVDPYGRRNSGTVKRFGESIEGAFRLNREADGDIR